MKEFQVYVSAPNGDWLNRTLNLVWSIPAQQVGPGKPPLEEIRRIWRAAVLTNCEEAENIFAQSLGFAELRLFGLAEATAFRQTDADIHAVMLNWNSDQQIPLKDAVSLLPGEFRDRCVSTPSESPLGRTVWQEFCASVTRACEKSGERYDLYVGAPTVRHLEAAAKDAGELLRDGKTPEKLSMRIPDLSYFNTAAVAVRLLPNDIREHRDQIVIQKKLETIVANTLSGCEVRSGYSPEEWERLLAEVFGIGSTDPWSNSETVTKVARQVDTDLLLLFTVQAAIPAVRFETSEPKLVSPAPGPPHTREKPDPNDRQYGLFGPL
ncbi:MAG: hypothetical protein ACUVRO_07160 [Armatimonadota bacterium]